MNCQTGSREYARPCRASHSRLSLFTIALLALLIPLSPVRAQSTKPSITSVLRIGLTVSDIDRSLNFYNALFNAHLRITSLRAPNGPGIEFLEYLTPTDGRPYPKDAKPNDLFNWQTTLTTDNLPRLQTNFQSHASTPISAPTDPHSPILLRDPDGHALLLRTGQSPKSL